MRYLLFSALLTLSFSGFSQEKGLQYYYSQALEAYKMKAYPKFYEMITEAHRLHPYHQGILYQLGLAAALTGHKDEALSELRKAILIDDGFKLEGIPDFNSIEQTPGFKALIALQKDYLHPVIHSDTAFVVRDRSLHAEGIAYDPSTKNFYLGSIHKRKIIKVTGDRSVSDFCPEGFAGMTSIFGLKIDEKQNTLWACSSPMQEMINYDSAARSAVFKFDLRSGKLLEKFQRPAMDKDGVYGDLVMNSKGEVFVSDSQTNTIFIVNEKTHQLVPYFTSPDFWNIQGLAFSERDQYLFIADYVKGIFRLDTKTKLLTTINCNLDVSLKGIDGLYYYQHSLITLQNGVSPARVMRYLLNPALEQINRYKVIDRKHPAFGEPTMGAFAGDIFYYIANSQWGGYDDQHHIKPDAQLQDIVILKIKVTPDF